jgi:hypothetical protein
MSAAAEVVLVSAAATCPSADLESNLQSSTSESQRHLNSPRASSKRAPIGSFNKAAAPFPAAATHTPKIKAGLIPRSTWRPVGQRAVGMQEQEEELPALEAAINIRIPKRPLLHDAAKDGDMEALLAALDQPNCELESSHLGQAAIHLAAKGGHTDAVALLLDRGAALHAKATNTGTKNSALVLDMGGATPLHCAAEMNQCEVINLLVDRGADVHARANCNDQPLHFAAREGYLSATKLLVARGADVHAQNDAGRTAYDDALHFGGGRCPCEDVSDRA